MIPSLFIGDQRSDIIYWKFSNSADTMVEYIPEICSYELFETYQNVTDILKQYYHIQNIPGLRLCKESLQMVRQEKLYLSGESMGLAWLLGLLCWIKKKKFPENLCAWGAIKPIRNGEFALFPTANTKRKMLLAEQNRMKRIILHCSERSSGHFSGVAIRCKSDLINVIKLMEKLINVH